MAVRGVYEHSLDSKDRLTVPARFRAMLADGVVLSKSLDPCVWLYTPSEFESIAERYISPHSPFTQEARELRRRFHGSSFDETLDSAGRVRLPKMLVDHAGLDGPCALVGAGEYLEIWNADAWTNLQADLDARGSDIAQGLLGGGE